MVKYALGIDTPGGIGAWAADGPLWVTTATDAYHAAAVIEDQVLPVFGLPHVIVVEKPHGIGPDQMHVQQSVLKNAVAAGFLAGRLSKQVHDKCLIMTAPVWRKRLGISGNRAQCKALARSLAEKAFDYVNEEPKGRLSEHACEGLCIAMSAWLMECVGDGVTEDTLVQMLGFHHLKEQR